MKMKDRQKKTSDPPISAAVRYWLFQIPELVVAGLTCALLLHLDWISFRTAMYAMAACILKDIVLFPLTVRAYRIDPPQTGTQRMIGLTTILKHPLTPRGIIQIRGERWQAVSASGQPISAGTQIRVVDTEQLTLLVEPTESR